MAGKDLLQLKTDLRVDLSDVAEAAWDADELERAIERAIADLSRFLPRELIFDLTLTSSNIDDDITIDLSDYIDVEDCMEGFIRVQRVEYPAGEVPQIFCQFDLFANKLTITGFGESQGQQALSEGDVLRIYYDAPHIVAEDDEVGTTPAFLDNTVLLAASAYALFQYVLQIEHQAVTDAASSRTALGSIAAIHTLVATALGNVSTYVADMNTALDAAIVQLVASGTALAKINNDSGRTYLTDADTALDAFVTAMSTTPAAALAKVDTYLAGASESTKALLAQIATDAAQLRTAIGTAVDAANTALDGIDYTDIATHLTSAATALAKVATYLESNTNEDSKYWLTKITTDIADLRTAINAAADAANTYLDAVAGDLTAADAANGYLADYVAGATAPASKKYLDEGDAHLNKIADGGEGQDVPRAYRDYANAVKSSIVDPYERSRELLAQNATSRTNAAMIFAQEAAQRLSNLRSYIEQSDGWGRIATGFISEATQRVSMAYQVILRERVKVEQAGGYMNEANSRLLNLRAYIDQAASYKNIADGFVEEARERVNIAASYISEAVQRLSIADRYLTEASGRTRSSDSYIAEAGGRFNMCQAFIAEAGSRMSEIDRYLGEADRYSRLVEQSVVLADKYRSDATERRNEAWMIWRDRTQYIGDFAGGSIRQMPSY